MYITELINIWQIILNNIDAVINYIPLFVFSVFSLKLRLTKRLTFIMFFLYSIVIIAASTAIIYIGGNNFFTKNYLFLFIVPLLLFYLIVVEDTLLRCMFVFFTIFTYSLFVDLNIAMMSKLYYTSTYSQELSIVLKITLHIFLYYPFSKYITIPISKIMDSLEKKYLYGIAIIPMAVCFVTLIISRDGFLYLGISEYLTISAICILSFCIFYIIYFMLKKTVSIIELKNNMMLAQSQLQMQREHYKQLGESMQQIKRMQHDTKYHYATIRELAHKNNTEGIIKYLNEVTIKQAHYTLRTVCENFAADAILRHYLMLAKSNKIIIKFSKVNIPVEIDIDSYDLSVVIGNCMENAIEACKKMDVSAAKKITVTADVKNSYLIFKVQNTFSGALEFNNGLPVTLKDKQSHGFGIQNIKAIADKYKGSVIIEQELNLFTIAIALFCGN